MNIKQASYQANRALNKYLPEFFLACSGVLGLSLAELWLDAEQSILKDPESMGLTVVGVAASIASIQLRNESTKVRKYHTNSLKYTEEECPLEFVEKVEILDLDGLQYLLERTEKSRKDFLPKEWGACFKININSNRQGTANIYDIVTSKDAVARGLIKESYLSVKIDQKNFLEEGNAGSSHYHPNIFGPFLSLNALNYSINQFDYFEGGSNSVNLLTFNMPEGPGIIAYNRRGIFLPENDEKSRFVKASTEEVMGFLAA